MSNLLSSLPKTIHASLALAVIFFLVLFYGNGGFDFDTIFWSCITLKFLPILTPRPTTTGSSTPIAPHRSK